MLEARREKVGGVWVPSAISMSKPGDEQQWSQPASIA